MTSGRLLTSSLRLSSQVPMFIRLYIGVNIHRYGADGCPVILSRLG